MKDYTDLRFRNITCTPLTFPCTIEGYIYRKGMIGKGEEQVGETTDLEVATDVRIGEQVSNPRFEVRMVQS